MEIMLSVMKKIAFPSAAISSGRWADCRFVVSIHSLKSLAQSETEEGDDFVATFVVIRGSCVIVRRFRLNDKLAHTTTTTTTKAHMLSKLRGVE